MSEIYVVPEFAGTQGGTKDNPFVARDAIEFDSLMREHAHLDTLDVHLNDGLFLTAGTREWDDTNDVQLNPGFRAGRHWTFDTETGATLAWDVDAVPDDRVSDVPLHLIMSTEARFDSRLNLHTPQDVWDLLPRGQAVRDLKIDLQFSRAVDRWRAKGKKLRIGAIALAGHEAAVERVHVTNYGAFGYEGFPIFIQGAYGMYDRNLIAQLDPAKYVYDGDLPEVECSHITDCVADGYVELSDVGDQVTVNAIIGGIGERTPGEWIYTYRAFDYQLRNRTVASGTNAVQAHTSYISLKSRIANNYSKGCNVLVYGDFFKTKRVEILDNVADDAHYLARFLLSPTAEGMGRAAEDFSHENYLIARNRSATGGIELNTLGPSTATRYIRDFTLEANEVPFFTNEGATGVKRTGNSFDVPDPAKKGCNPFSRFF